MRDVAALYAEGRGRITKLVSGLGPELVAGPVPCCPDWTVHDVMAHVTGVCTDILAGHLAGVGTDPWTAAQVEARRERSIDELVDEWSDVAPQVEAFANNFPERMGEQWVADLTTHEHDIRGAIGEPGERDTPQLRTGLGFLVEMAFARSLEERGLPALCVRAGGEEWTIGGDEAGTTLEASPFELFRALTGRRSTAQLRAMNWSGDAEPYVAAFEYGPFVPSAVDITE